MSKIHLNTLGGDQSDSTAGWALDLHGVDSDSIPGVPEGTLRI